MAEHGQNRSASLTPREQKEEQARFRAPIKHNRLQRKEGYDYSRPGMYLITVTTANRQRLLGTLAGDTSDTARVEPSPLGESVVQAFRQMATRVTRESGCRVQVLQYQIMPDHFHGILYIRDMLPSDWTLGRMIAGWKGECSRLYWASSSFRSSDVSSRHPFRSEICAICTLFCTPKNPPPVEAKSAKLDI